MAEVNWERRERLNISKIGDEIEKLSKEVVNRQVADINNQIQMLQRMGLVKDNEKFNALQEKMKQLNLGVDK